MDDDQICPRCGQGDAVYFGKFGYDFQCVRCQVVWDAPDDEATDQFEAWKDADRERRDASRQDAIASGALNVGAGERESGAPQTVDVLKSLAEKVKGKRDGLELALPSPSADAGVAMASEILSLIESAIEELGGES